MIAKIVIMAISMLAGILIAQSVQNNYFQHFCDSRGHIVQSQYGFIIKC